MTLRVVLGIALIYHVMIHATRPLISLFAAQLGASTFEIGALAASFSAVSLLLAVQAGKIADYAGDRLPIFGGAVLAAAGIGLPFFFPSLWALYASQILVGISQVFIHLSLQNVLGNSAADHQRDHYFSMLSTAMSVGALVGPIVGGYTAEHFSYSAAFLVSMIVGILPIVLSVWIPVVIKRVKSSGIVKKAGSLDLLKITNLRKSIFAAALVLYSRDIYVAYFPLYASAQGMSASQIGWIVTMQGLAMVAVRAFIAKLVGKFDREKILIVAIVISGLAFIMIPLSGHIAVFALLAVLIGGGLGVGQPLTMSSTYSASPDHRRGEVLGLKLAVNRLTLTAAPLFFGLVGTVGGLAPVFILSGLFLIGGSPYTRFKKPPPQINQ